ncbi:MAG: SDR family oxidoreductase [Gemmatimonadaceae bacterium]
MRNSTNDRTSFQDYDSLRRELTSAPKTWLVTGVAGFIGSNIMEQLLGLGQTVVGLDNFSTGHQANIDDALEIAGEARGRFRLITGDIREPKACAEACRGVDYVLHHAALGSVPRSIDDPATSNQVNVDGTLNVFAAARDAKVRRVVYASSSAVYGDTVQLPQAEEITGRPLSPYAATKGANELYAAAFQMSYGVQLIGLRYFNVFGRRQDPNGAYAAVIPRWVASQLDGEVCRIFGSGEDTRDYVFVKDVVQANILAACGDELATNQVYNVGRGESTSLLELFGLVREALVEFDSSVDVSPPVHEPERLGDIPRSVADITKAKRMLGFAPRYAIAAGLSEALEWYARSSSAAG